MMPDVALKNREAAGKPIHVALMGAGAAGRAIALQLATPPPGIHLAAIVNRTPQHGERAFREAGVERWRWASSTAAADAALGCGIPVLTDDPAVITCCQGVDLIIEATGTIEYAARSVVQAFQHGKHVVLMNAELDSLVGPILKIHADRAGVVLTHTDGEEPGVAMTLLRYLRSLGLRPVAAGNLKGMVDHYRTPETQQKFAQQYDQDPHKVTSFADATKLSMETAVLANATGFRAGKRGMYGPVCEHVREMAHLLPADQMLATGLVDYALGAAPHTGAFVVVYEENPAKQAQMGYVKMGEGPFYVFYTPFHLPHIQIASTIGRAVEHHDATVAPLDGPVCEVISLAKRDLKAGERLDQVGGYCAYGLIENTEAARAVDALPLALAEDSVLRRDIAKDEVISFADVMVPRRNVVDELWREQSARWPRGN